MRRIKFSEDLEKLPEDWPGTKAKLVAVHPVNLKEIKENFPLLWYKDIKIRNEDRYFDFDFDIALLLIFLHPACCQPLSTFRRYDGEKRRFYENNLGEYFTLIDTRKEG